MPALLGELFEGLCVSFVRVFLSSFKFLSSGRRGRWGDNQAFAVGGDIERGFGADVQKVENGPIDNQSQAVSVFCQSLDQTPSVYPMYHH